jgi:type IV secretion system protein VirB2
MITTIAIQQTSLTDPAPASAITSAASWIGDLLFGTLATTVAVIAIACVGLAMLSGRIEIRRGLAVVFGCFLVFGARGIADGLRSSSISDSTRVVTRVPPPPTFAKPPPAANAPNGYDPYAGAAVM